MPLLSDAVQSIRRCEVLLCQFVFRLRHRQRPTPARVEITDGGLRITLAEPQFPSAPGQVAAIYDEQGRVLAGALVRELF